MVAAALAAVALVLPGLGIELTLVKTPPGAHVRTVRAFLLSLAFWPLAIFLTRIPFFSLKVLAWGGLVFGAFLVGRARSRSERARAQTERSEGLSRSRGYGGNPRSKTDARPKLAWSREALVAAAFVAMALAHLGPLGTWVVAPGNDMSMHTFMTRLIVESRGLPTSYEPIFPIHDFGSYAAGLPAIAAVLVALTGMTVQKASLVVSLLAYPALAGALSLVARRFVGPLASVFAGFVTIASCESHAFLLWGGNPTILSFALAFAAMSCVVLVDRTEQAKAFPLFAVGAGLVHVIPLLGVVYALPLAALGWLAFVPRDEIKPLLRAWAPLLVIAAVLLGIPFVLGARPHVSRHELEWVARWQRTTWHGYHGDAHDFLTTIWPYLYQHLAYGVGVLAAGVVAQTFLFDRRQLPWIPYAVVVLLLVLNSRYWVLPGSPALYPERMLVLLLAPTAALTGCLFTALSKVSRVGVTVVGGALLAWAVTRPWLAIERAGQRITVTENDVALLAWMHDNLPPNAVVANNYGDAGAWIPALAFRAATHPHTNPFYFDEIDAWRLRTAPTYLFLGEKRFYDIQYTLDAVRSAPAEYVEDRSTGDAYLFTIVHPHPAPPTEGWMGR